MKKFLLSIGAMLLCGTPMVAYDFMEGSLAYNKLTDTTVEVTFKGDKGYRSGKDYTDAAYVIPATVTHDGVTYSVTQIGDGAFYGSPLQTVSIPEGIVTIGKDAFSESGLTAVKLPSTVKEIKQGGFHMCYDMASLELNEGLETLGWDVFNNARALETVTIPGTIKTIPSNAFGYSGLKTVIVNPGVESIKQAFQNCKSLSSISLPETLMELDGTFEECTALKEIKLPASLRTIGWFTFASTGITELVVNEGLETLDMQSLGMMNGDWNADYTLKKVTLPSSLKSIDGMALNNRRGLTHVIVRATVPPTAGTFGDYVYNATLCVPAGTADAYRNAAGWSGFSNIEEERILVTDVNFGPGTEEGVINVPVRQLIGLKPVIVPADADNLNVEISLSDCGTSKEDATCSMYRVNWWDVDNKRTRFYELSGHRPTGDKPAKLHVKSADGNFERDFVVNVIEADRTPRANGYEDGTIILNEEWFGHTNGGLNYFTEDDEIIYQAYEKENPCMAFGATSQYGTIWGGKLIVASKQAQDGGDPLPGGGRLVIADAKTLKRLGSLDNLTWDGISGDGRAVAGATPDKIYVGSSNGIYIVDITDPTAPEITGRIGKESNTDLYNGQIGDMTTAGNHVFAVKQSTGLIIINVNDDTTTEIADANIQGVTQSADGHVWYATIQNGCSVFVALDHETLEEVDRVTMPAEIGTVACGWGAWRSTAFHGSPKTNDLWFVTGAAAIMGGASGDYFRYHIGDDPKNIKPFFSLNDVKGINGFGEEVGQMTYGTPKYDDRNNRLIVMAGRKGAASGGYRDHWLHYVDGTTGEISKTFHLNPYYWFQSLPIFPDKHDAEIRLENMELDIVDGAKTFDLSELVDDKDSHNANIRFSLLDTPALMADGAQTEAHAEVTLEGKTLTVTPKSAGQHYFTLAAESNGRTVTKTIGVNVKNTQVGIDAVGAEGSLYCDGGRLFINGFNGQRFHVYSMEGIEVVSFDVDSDSYTFDFGSHAGVYVVTSDNGMSAKVIIR